MKQTFRIIFISCIAGFALPAFAAEQPITDVGTLDETSAKEAFPAKPPYSPYAGRNFPTRPFFGDTHVHTSFSMDAGAFGCRLGPTDAYRFAKGEEVTASSGQRARLARPLDFIVVRITQMASDFSRSYLAAIPICWHSARPEVVRHDQFRQGRRRGSRHHHKFFTGRLCQRISVARHAGLSQAWQETIKAADEANDPGQFTAFIGYEWTSNDWRKQPSSQCHLPRERL